jgi:NIPSNAP
MRLRAFLTTVRASTARRWKSIDWESKGLAICGITLVSVAAGSLVTAGVVQVNQVSADSPGVFELRIYHAVPGKMPALETRFRDTTSTLLAKNGLKVVGYWVAEDASATLNNTFVFMLAHPSREKAKDNWDAMRADPEFQAMVKSEQADKLTEKVDSAYMRPTDFSPGEVGSLLATFNREDVEYWRRLKSGACPLR